MQIAARTSSARPVCSRGPRVATARPAAVVCQAQKRDVAQVAQKGLALAATLPALIAASPAFALVDDRLNGDGTGLPFGINDGVLGWVLVGMFGSLWALWFNAQKDLGDFEDPDAGLKIDDTD